MSALGQKQTFAAQSPCPLYPRKRTCAVQIGMSAMGQKRTSDKDHDFRTPIRLSLPRTNPLMTSLYGAVPPTASAAGGIAPLIASISEARPAM